MKTMKHYFLIVSLIFTVISINAQDILITQKGDPLKVYEVEISTSSVFYKLENKTDAPLYKMNKSDVMMIKYQDGHKVIMGEENSSVSINGTTNKNKSVSKAYSPEIIKKNKEWVEAYNKRNTFEFVKPKNIQSELVICTFGYKKNSMLFTDDINIEYEFNVYEYDRNIEITIHNISEKTIYIDLGNSFFTRFNGEAVTMYTPTATTESSTQNIGMGVNLGAVSNALGVGGVAGIISQGVNIGGGTTSGTSCITYSQRIIAIPPKSSKNINHWPLFNINDEISFFKNGNYGLRIYKKINRGEKLLYTEENTPLQLSVLVSYSYNENCTDLKTVNTQLYLKEMLGVTQNAMLSERSKSKNIIPNFKKESLYIISSNYFYRGNNNKYSDYE